MIDNITKGFQKEIYNNAYFSSNTKIASGGHPTADYFLKDPATYYLLCSTYSADGNVILGGIDLSPLYSLNDIVFKSIKINGTIKNYGTSSSAVSNAKMSFRVCTGLEENKSGYTSITDSISVFTNGTATNWTNFSKDCGSVLVDWFNNNKNKVLTDNRLNIGIRLYGRYFAMSKLEAVIEYEYTGGSLIFNGSSNITSAYLGNTKLNGIYLGSQKLL